MVPLRRHPWRRVVSRFPAELVQWPFELLLILTSVVVVGLSIVVDVVPPHSIAHTAGRYWALGWSALLLLAASVLLRGLRKDEIEGIIVGLRMHGILILTYAAVTLTVGTFPLSILGASLMSTTGIIAMIRACALNRARHLPPREV